MDTITFDDYTFPARITSFSPNFHDSAPKTNRLPGVHGGYDQDGELPARQSIGNISISFILEGTSESDILSKVDAVMALKRKGRQKLTWTPYSGATPRWCYAKVNSIPTVKQYPDNQNANYRRVTINFQVANPFWFEDATTDVQAVSGTSTTWTITPGGSWDSTPTIQFVGTATSFKLQRSNGGTVLDEVFYNAAISAGTLVINGEKKEVTLNSSNAYADFSAKYRTRWFVIPPDGGGTIDAILNSGGAGTVTIQYKPTYV